MGERRFEGQTAILTGSSRGIGFATAARLAREGAAVVVNARDAAEAEAAAAAIRAQGGRAIAVAGSVGDEGVATRLAEAAVREFGRLDLVYNGVGVNRHYGPVLAATEADFLRTYKLNAFAPVAVVQAAVAAGLGRGGAVVNLSATGARRVHPMLPAYTASKAALDMITATLARELGAAGIRVNGVAPGLVRTRMAAVLWEGERGEAEASLVPLQRLGEPEDIAAAVCFLLSDDAAWITGVVLPVDGGRLLVGSETKDLLGVFDLDRERERQGGGPSVT
ncbi:MAG: glucose 1-dehydrogenase [Chloroflexi bacterium]|nr:MAG: glucose 1-dehydrogenase [Chloroflexota bacterium]